MNRIRKRLSIVLSLFMAVVLLVPATADFVNAEETRMMNVNYVTEDGSPVKTVRVAVGESATEITKGDLQFIPEDYDIVEGELPKAIVATDSAVTIKVKKHVETPAFRMVRVEYINEAGTAVDTRRVKVNKGKDDTITVVAPEGYDLIGESEVLVKATDTTVKVMIKKHVEAPKTRWIHVEFINAAGAKVATKRVEVEYGKLAMTVVAPEGYDLVDTNNVISIDDNTTTVKVAVTKKVIEEPAKTRWIRVEYINAAGAVVATKRVEVEYGRLTLSVFAPEGYDLVDTNNVISIDDNTKTVKVAVMKIVDEPEENTKPNTDVEVNTPEENKDKAPNTGDRSNMLLWSTLLIGSAVCLFVNYKKRIAGNK